MNSLRLLAPLAVAVLAFAQPPARKQVEVFGQKIYYIEAGSGPAVILLHGLGGDASIWSPTLAALASRYHVYAPDQIGFGASDKPMINYRVGTLVDFLEGFCKKLALAKSAVVGNSLGGWTAMAFTLAHPEQVQRLVLVDSAGFSPARTGGGKISRELLLALNPSTLEGTRQLMGLLIHNQAMLTPEFIERVYADHLRKNDGYVINQFIESILRGEDFVDGKLGAIKAPTLIIWGREDRLTLLAGGRALNQDIAGSQLVILDGCGHVPQAECAAPFNAALLEFLGGGQP